MLRLHRLLGTTQHMSVTMIAPSSTYALTIGQVGHQATNCGIYCSYKYISYLCSLVSPQSVIKMTEVSISIPTTVGYHINLLRRYFYLGIYISLNRVRYTDD